MYLPRKVFLCVVSNKLDALAGIEIGPEDMTTCDNCSGTLIGKHPKAFFLRYFSF